MLYLKKQKKWSGDVASSFAEWKVWVCVNALREATKTWTDDVAYSFAKLRLFSGICFLTDHDISVFRTCCKRDFHLGGIC